MHGQEDKLSALAVISIGLSHYIVADKHVILSASWGQIKVNLSQPDDVFHADVEATE